MTENRIVVGVDGSPTSARALRWAVDEAVRRGATVEAIHVWHSDYAFYAMAPFGSAVSVVPPGTLEQVARRCLNDTVDSVDQSGLTQPIQRILAQGGAARELLDAAKNAAMLVVGTHGRGGFAGMLLGSVSQHVTHHAPCPVVLVPAE
jgi:nucleotide-binding universal stress UspA family protein